MRFSTSRVAAAVGVHPNTVRLYEQWGFLQPVPRGANGYRMYGQEHVDQMTLARAALHGGWPGRAIRRSALDLVRTSASGDAEAAMALARRHLGLVRAERRQAETAAAFLEEWARRGRGGLPAGGSLSIGATAAEISLTVDTLRSWERNRLIKPPRTAGGYRMYGPAEMGRLRVIRMLYLAGYSTMSILRFMSAFDGGAPRVRQGEARRILDTPDPGEDVYSASDRWLTTLAELEARARRLISLLKAMGAPLNR